MKTELLISQALDHLPAGFTLSYKKTSGKEHADGRVELTAPNGEKTLFSLYVKHIHRMETLVSTKLQIEEHEKTLPALLVCNQLTPALAAYCAQNQINFIDTAGNIRIELPHLYVLIEGKQEKKAKAARGKFPSGVMKLLFVLLSSPEQLDKPYRQLAELAGVSLGMVSKGFDFLEQQRYVRKSKSGRRIIGEDELRVLWVKDYAHSLKPSLDQLKMAIPDSWESLSLNADEYSGGELAAADLSNGYLLPVSGILYTPHSLLQRRKELALKPAREGAFVLIASFWGTYVLNSQARAMLCLADLLDSGDDRSREVARIINDKYLHLNEATLFSY